MADNPHTPAGGGDGDLSWLAGRIGRADYTCLGCCGGRAESPDADLAALVAEAGAGTVCEPTRVAEARRAAGPHGRVIALIGWPTGRHHSLIKAAEARMAVEDGADEVWVAVDAEVLAEEPGRDSEAATAAATTTTTAAVNAALADIIAVSQMVDEPTRFGITCSDTVGERALQELADAAVKVGVDVVAVGVEKRDAAVLPAVAERCSLAVHGRIDSLDAAADALLEGAERVYPAG
ncbi:hypothetical protein [Corynebacterium sp. P8-C1]|uniref:hypothetical protein n=1 Tax=Corynebacterium sp. P8-C1 TaxID=3059082 RepID=UPI00265C9327|nr:hypothetical protein [Corynebacterium sp. P8-C1]WKK62409.1 hypothetical protein QYR04_05855 [Corynebacterium sp. P8-C1]